MQDVFKIKNSLSVNLVTRLSVSRFATSRDAQVQCTRACACAYRHVYSIRVAKATKRVSVRVRFPHRPLKSPKCNGERIGSEPASAFPAIFTVQGVLLIPAYSARGPWWISSERRARLPWHARCRIFVENEETPRSFLRFALLFRGTE